MRVPLLLLAFVPLAASAQSLEGDYESLQRGREIHRTLHLDRDGGLEIVTEIPGDGEPNDREDYSRYGWTAGEAARGRPVHQTGRWTLREGRIEVRLDAVRDRSGFRTRGREDADLVRRDGRLVLSRVDAMYGRDEIEFRPVRGAALSEPPREAPSSARPVAPTPVEYDGTVRYEGDPLTPESIDFVDEAGKGRILVRAGKDSFEIRGDVERRGDETILRVAGDDVDKLFGRDGGALTIVMERGKVRSIRGTARFEGHRFEFGDRHPIEGGNFITP